jgi:hypothetical protein
VPDKASTVQEDVVISLEDAFTSPAGNSFIGARKSHAPKSADNAADLPMRIESSTTSIALPISTDRSSTDPPVMELVINGQRVLVRGTAAINQHDPTLAQLTALMNFQEFDHERWLMQLGGGCPTDAIAEVLNEPLSKLSLGTSEEANATIETYDDKWEANAKSMSDKFFSSSKEMGLEMEAHHHFKHRGSRADV